MQKVKQARAQVARLELSAAQAAVLDGQAHTARALWNLLHEYVTFRQGRLATLKQCDDAIRTARREIDWMRRLPAQAAQAVLKTYRQAWANFFNPDHPAGRPAPGTSQICHRCGHRDPAARDGTRFSCTDLACGWVGHADANAAINIRNAAGTAVSGRGDLGAARSAKRQPPRAA